MKRIISLVLLLTAGAGILFSAHVVDRMAVAYLSGARRVVGEGSWGEKLPDDGPVPGYLFLGFTRPSENPKGMTIHRPRKMARELGLAPGDVVTEVGGKSFSSSQDLTSHLVRTTQAGQRLSLTAVTPGEEARELTVTLRALVRHPGDLDLPYENVEIRSDSGYLLQGWLVPPPERSDGRLGIFVHGAKASRFQALEGGAKHWYRRGYGLLMMDLSGRGTSEGEYITYTMNERHDVTSMLRWARHHPKINPERLVLFGTSNGAAAAIYAASQDALLSALAVDAPYGDLWDAAGSMLRSRGGYSVLRYPLSLAMRLRAGVDMKSVRPSDVITAVKAQVLFVHGDADKQVPVTHSEAMHEARRSAGLPSELWVLPGGEHGFDNYPPEGIFWNRILDFFDRVLGGPPPEWEL